MKRDSIVDELKLSNSLNIIVCNRDKAESHKFHFPHLLISISAPNDKPKLPINKNRIAILSLEFHDLDKPYKDYKLFSEEDAYKIFEFLKQNKEIRDIVVHCDAGISRSPAVAAALAKIFNGDDSEYFKEYLPNMLVYKMMLDVWWKLNESKYSK